MGRDSRIQVCSLQNYCWHRKWHFLQSSGCSERQDDNHLLCFSSGLQTGHKHFAFTGRAREDAQNLKNNGQGDMKLLQQNIKNPDKGKKATEHWLTLHRQKMEK